MRLARLGDEAALFRIFLDAFKDNGWGGIDLDVVAEVARKACQGDTYVAAIVPGQDRIEAVIGFQPTKMWYGDGASWYWSDLLFYVHPLHRRSRHYARLFQFARWWGHSTRMPVVLGIQSTARTRSKSRMFARNAKELGGSFLIDAGDFRPAQRPI